MKVTLIKKTLNCIIIFYVIFSNFYNHWLHHIFYSSSYHDLVDQMYMLVSSPRIILLSILSLLTTYQIFFDKNKGINENYKSILYAISLSLIYFLSLPLDVYSFHFLRFLIVVGIIKYLNELFLFFIRTVNNDLIKSILTFPYIVIILFFIGEVITMNINLRTFNGQAYVTRNWQEKYIKLNELGFRYSHFKNDSSKKNLIFLGDSFVKGEGIEDEEDRFSDIVGFELKDKYNTYNLGSSGANTKNELNNLLNFKFQADVLVFVYYGNDIEYLSLNQQNPSFTTKNSPSVIVNTMTKYSYLINFLGIFRDMYSFTDDYVNALKSKFHNKSLWFKHKEDLNEIITYCNNHDTKLYVLIMPFIQCIKDSKFYTDKLLNFFVNQNIECVDIGELLINEKTSDIVVNRFDSHLNEKGNLIIAKKLLKLIEE